MVDRHGERYTHGFHESVLRAHSWRTVENSAAYLIPYLESGSTILDIGCGPGTITVDLARRVAPGRVIGLDTSAEVLAVAGEYAEQEGVGNVEFVGGDAYALDFPDDGFDIVHAHQVLQHVADPVAVLREMRRVVRHEGVVAVRDIDYGGIMWFPQLPGLAKWRELYDKVHRSNGGEPDAGRRVKAWAIEAGFSAVQSTASIWCFNSDEERAWWGNIWAERALHSAFADEAITRGFATQEELDEVAAAWIQWAADPAGWLAMPHGEVLGRG